MDEQLREWGIGREDREEVAMGWMNAPVPHDAMPGLVTEEQIAHLQHTEGLAADALFLELMAEPHGAAGNLTTCAAKNADSAAVRGLRADRGAVGKGRGAKGEARG